MMQATHIEKMQARKSPEQRALTPVTLGKSPADSTWVCYPRDGEAVEAFQARVATMKDRLARLWAKHVRQVKLTKGQARWLEAVMDSCLPDQDFVEDDSDCKLSPKFKFGATFVRGTGNDLSLLAELTHNMKESGDYMGCMTDDVPEHLWYIHERQLLECLDNLSRKLSN